MTELQSDIEQLVDCWRGRNTYDSDQDWLENVGHQIGVLCEMVGYGLAEVVGTVPAPCDCAGCDTCGSHCTPDCESGDGEACGAEEVNDD